MLFQYQVSKMIQSPLIIINSIHQHWKYWSYKTTDLLSDFQIKAAQVNHQGSNLTGSQPLLLIFNQFYWLYFIGCGYVITDFL